VKEMASPITCTSCGQSERVRRHGLDRYKEEKRQRYICANCGYQWTAGSKKKARQPRHRRDLLGMPDVDIEARYYFDACVASRTPFEEMAATIEYTEAELSEVNLLVYWNIIPEEKRDAAVAHRVAIRAAFEELVEEYDDGKTRASVTHSLSKFHVLHESS